MYQIEPHHRQKAQEIGVQIYPSKKGNYKLDVYKKGQYITSIGDIRYKDFVMYWKEKGKEQKWLETYQTLNPTVNRLKQKKRYKERPISQVDNESQIESIGKKL